MGGEVQLVGAGPGDPGLLTRLGAKALGRAEVVIYDHLASSRLLALAPTGATRIYVGKAIGRCAASQAEINALLVEHARLGRRVVRLKGGDPYVFGRGAEEVEYLRARGIAARVVPGVTSGVGVTAYAGLAITHRETASAVAFVTGHAESGPNRIDWTALARFPGTLVIYMGATRIRAIGEALIAGGMASNTPAAVVMSGTTPAQRTVVAPLADLADRATESGIGPPALLVVGAVVDRRPLLNWFEDLPLFGRRIVVTRPEADAGGSGLELEALGAEVLEAPTVAIRLLDDFDALDRTIGRLREFDWLAFTSAHGVTHFLDRLDAVGLDLRAVGHLQLAAIGPSTAECLAEYRLRADVVPTSSRSEDLAEALAPRVAGARILLARADRGRDLLREVLEPIAHVEQVAAYRNVDAETIDPEVVRRLTEGSVDWVTLTSSAIAERLHAILSKPARARIGREIRVASIGPITSATAAQLGWTVAVEASPSSWDGLVRGIVQAEAVQRSSR